MKRPKYKEMYEWEKASHYATEEELKKIKEKYSELALKEVCEMDGNLAMADHIVNMTEEEMDQLQQMSEPNDKCEELATLRIKVQQYEQFISACKWASEDGLPQLREEAKNLLKSNA